MAVASETSKVNYSATGLSTYAVPFYFTKDTHLEVYISDVLKTLNEDYTVSGAGNEEGGEITILGDAPASGTVTIRRNLPLLQESSFNDGGPNDAAGFEAKLDELVMIDQQQSEALSRAALLPVSSSMNGTLPSGLQPNETIAVNEEGTGFTRGPTTTQIAAAESFAVAAAASADNSAASATAAASSAGQAASSASDADNSATRAETAANSVIFQDNVFVTAIDSPIQIDETYRGACINCDCSTGPIEINLPEISGIDQTWPFTLAIKKTDTSGNSVTVNPGGSDKIDGGGVKTFGSATSGAVFMPDVDPTPDEWTTAEFGSSAGNMTVDAFMGDGTTLEFTLSVSPGSRNNAQVFIGGVYQAKTTYTLSGTTLTLDEAPPADVPVEVVIGTSLSIGTPSDGTVSLEKLAQDVLNFLIPRGVALPYFDDDVPAGFISAMGKTIGISGADYSGETYYLLFEKLWRMGGLSTTAGHPFVISAAKGASALEDWQAGKTITVDFVSNEIFFRAKGGARDLGSYQADELKSHAHNITNASDRGSLGGWAATGGRTINGGGLAGYSTTTVPTATTGGAETRPKNVAANFIMKY